MGVLSVGLMVACIDYEFAWQGKRLGLFIGEY
jgi:hypothetical protein